MVSIAASMAATPVSRSRQRHMMTKIGCAISRIDSSQPSGRGAASARESASFTASMPAYSAHATSIFAFKRTASWPHFRCTARSMSLLSWAAFPDRSRPGRLKSSSSHRSTSPLTCLRRASKASWYLLNKGHDTFMHKSSTSTLLEAATWHMTPCTAFAFAKASSLAAAASGSTFRLERSSMPFSGSTRSTVHISVLPTRTNLWGRTLRLESSVSGIMPSFPPYSSRVA
mmetsp:Transcript_4127/g.12432  ORF Transcript_4127/g.12432 Transcript_4127/m.12432 type:complete len:229 (-) Transcript_4127:105-791(-)